METRNMTTDVYEQDYSHRSTVNERNCRRFLKNLELKESNEKKVIIIHYVYSLAPSSLCVLFGT